MIKHEEKKLAKSKKTKNLVIMLHGVGSNSSDLIGLVDYLNLNQHTTYLSPNAPHEYDMAPSGYQWFSLRDISEEAMYLAMKKEAKLLDDYIDNKLNEYNLKPENLIVLGFSQGAMIALHVFPRRNKPINSIIAISGALINPTILASEIISKPDVLLIHGNLDQVVPFAAFDGSRKHLAAVGINCDSFVMQDTGHNINPPALLKIQKYLKDRDFT